MSSIVLKSITNALMGAATQSESKRAAAYLTIREWLGALASYSLMKSGIIEQILQTHQSTIVKFAATQMKKQSYTPLKIIETSLNLQFKKHIPRISGGIAALVGFILMTTPNTFLARSFYENEESIETLHDRMTPRWEFSPKNIMRIVLFSLYLSTFTMAYYVANQVDRIWVKKIFIGL